MITKKLTFLMLGIFMVASSVFAQSTAEADAELSCYPTDDKGLISFGMAVNDQMKVGMVMGKSPFGIEPIRDGEVIVQRLQSPDDQCLLQITFDPTDPESVMCKSCRTNDMPFFQLNVDALSEEGSVSYRLKGRPARTQTETVTCIPNSSLIGRYCGVN